MKLMTTYFLCWHKLSFSPPQERGILILEKEQHFQVPFDTFLVGGDTAQVSELNSAMMTKLYFGHRLTTIFTGCIWR
jgi:hypothetical protein